MMHQQLSRPGACSARRGFGPQRLQPAAAGLPSIARHSIAQSRSARLVVQAQQTQQIPPQPPRTPPGRIEPNMPGPAQYGMPPPPGGLPPYGQQQFYQPPPPPQQKQGETKLGSYANALIAAAFVAGLGIGVYFDSEVTLSPNNVSSTEIIDRSTPNADICMANGYSASVFDMKLYVTFNP